MLRVSLAALVLLLALLLPAGAQPPAGKKYAVLVGVNKYDHPKVKALEWAVNDVTALAEVLTKQGYECVVLTDDTGAKDEKRKPTRENVVKELVGALNKCRKADTVLVALSGHGCQFPDEKDGYFMPADGRPFRDRTHTMIPLGTVYSELDKSAAGMKVLIVDACRSEPTKNETTRGVFVDTVPVPKGIAAFFACSNGEYALEAPDLKHGVFFHHLLQGLKGEAAGKDGKVTFGRLADHVQSAVSEDVKKRTNGKLTQSPNVRADLSGPPPVLAITAGSASAATVQAPGNYPDFFYDAATAKELLKKYPPVKPRYDPSDGDRPVVFGDDFARVLLSGELKGKGGPYNAARLYDLATGKTAGPVVELELGEVVRAVAPDGVRLFTARRRDKDRPVTRLVNGLTGATIGVQATPFHDLDTQVHWLRFSPAGTDILLYACQELVRAPLDGGPAATGRSVEGAGGRLTQDGKFFYSGNLSKHSFSFQLARLSSMKKVDLDKLSEAMCPGLPPEPRADYGKPGFDAEAFEAQRKAYKRLEEAAERRRAFGTAYVSPDGSAMMARICWRPKPGSSYEYDDRHEYWSLAENKLIRLLPEPDLESFGGPFYRGYPFSAGGDRFSAFWDKGIGVAPHLVIFELNKTSSKPTVVPLGKSRLDDATWDFKGERIATLTYHEATLSNDGGYAVRVWDAAIGKAVGQPIVVSEKQPRITFTPDGKQIAAVWDSAVSVYEVGTGKLVRRIELSAD